jgi:pimeloyl-ACP methyl ester carboxylesterase
MAVVALICAQMLVCYVFYKTQWQYVLQPSRELTADPSQVGLTFASVRFGVDSSGQPQLDGWWIPASSSAGPTPAANAALLLHSGSGSMSDALPDALMLHHAGLSVLLFDYRGYGKSGGQHPDEQMMETDAGSALRYLTGTRGLAAKQIVVFGAGVGAALAVRLCSDHPELPATILWNASGDFTQQVKRDNRVRVVPVGLLFNQNFPLATPLANLPTPKLLITTNSPAASAAFARARDPKTTVEVKADDAAALAQSIDRFLDTYLPKPIPTLGR